MSLPSKTRWHEHVELALLCWDECSADCDGMTAIISHHLRRASVSHTCVQGGLYDRTTGDLVAPHFWICLNDEYLIDLRARKWLGEDEMVHMVYSTQTLIRTSTTPGKQWSTSVTT